MFKYLVEKIKHIESWDLRRLYYYLRIRQQIYNNWFFEIVLLATEFKEILFGFYATGISIANDSIQNLEFSWDGTNIAGKLYNKETIDLDSLNKDRIYVKGIDTCRIWAF